jgi:streptomycin 6-kinase
LADPAAFDFAAARSAAGRAWVAALPALFGDLARRWNLTASDQPIRHGYNAVVLSVGQAGRPLAVKLIWPPGQASGEAAALAAWRGRGAVELVACDVPRGALLLERLDAARSLASLPVADAAATAGALVRTLAIEAPGSSPAVAAEARTLAAELPARGRGTPVPRWWIARAAGLAAGLARDPERLLVHTDLHHGNILASARAGWLAIDPRAAAGAPERAVAEMLWTRADELPDPAAIVSLLDTVVRHGRLDRAKAIAWAFVRVIDYWLWGLENGLTIDPDRCRRVAGALEPLTG